MGPADSYRSTKACDETKPRVKVTLSWPGIGLAPELDAGLLRLAVAQLVLRHS